MESRSVSLHPSGESPPPSPILNRSRDCVSAPPTSQELKRPKRRGLQLTIASIRKFSGSRSALGKVAQAGGGKGDTIGVDSSENGNGNGSGDSDNKNNHSRTSTSKNAAECDSTTTGTTTIPTPSKSSARVPGLLVPRMRIDPDRDNGNVSGPDGDGGGRSSASKTGLTDALPAAIPFSPPQPASSSWPSLSSFSFPFSETTNTNNHYPQEGQLQHPSGAVDSSSTDEYIYPPPRLPPDGGVVVAGCSNLVTSATASSTTIPSVGSKARATVSPPSASPHVPYSSSDRLYPHLLVTPSTRYNRSPSVSSLDLFSSSDPESPFCSQRRTAATTSASALPNTLAIPSEVIDLLPSLSSTASTDPTRSQAQASSESNRLSSDFVPPCWPSPDSFVNSITPPPRPSAPPPLDLPAPGSSVMAAVTVGPAAPTAFPTVFRPGSGTTTTTTIPACLPSSFSAVTTVAPSQDDPVTLVTSYADTPVSLSLVPSRQQTRRKPLNLYLVPPPSYTPPPLSQASPSSNNSNTNSNAPAISLSLSPVGSEFSADSPVSLISLQRHNPAGTGGYFHLPFTAPPEGYRTSPRSDAHSISSESDRMSGPNPLTKPPPVPRSAGSVPPRSRAGTGTVFGDRGLGSGGYGSMSQSQKFHHQSHTHPLPPRDPYTHSNSQQQQQQPSRYDGLSGSSHNPHPLPPLPGSHAASPTSPVQTAFLNPLSASASTTPARPSKSTSDHVASAVGSASQPHRQMQTQSQAKQQQQPLGGAFTAPSARHPWISASAGPAAPSGLPNPSLGSRIAASDAAHLLALMQQSGGCVEGRLYVRRDAEDSWVLTFCKIDPKSGSLIATTPNPSSDTPPTILVPDLRGCQISTHHDPVHNSIYMDILPRAASARIHIRAESLDIYHRWFAAMLCWPPLLPKGRQNMAIKQQPSEVGSGLRRHDGGSSASGTPEVSTIKIGMMEYLDPSTYSLDSIGFRGGGVFGRPNIFRSQSYIPPSWLNVSCLLKENGELQILKDGVPTTIVQLSQLSRSAIQRLDPSVLHRDYCIAIYPQYASPTAVRSLDRPIYFCITPRPHYEAWVVLFRAFAVPQLYGPKLISPSSPPSHLQSEILDNLFRMDRTLSIRISSLNSQRLLEQLRAEPGGYFVEIQLDGEVRGRTPVVDEKGSFSPCEFEFQDVPDSTSVVTFVLKRRNTPQPAAPTRDKESRRLFDALSFSSGPSSSGGSGSKSKHSGGTKSSIGTASGGRVNTLPIVSVDTVVGYCDINLVEDLEMSQTPLSESKEKANPLFTCHTADRTWVMLSATGQPVATLMAVLTSEETAMLVSRHYQELSSVLHDFTNRITNDLADLLPLELKRLSSYLLNIYQVTGSAKDWILSLVEEELDDYEDDLSPLFSSRGEIGLFDRITDPERRQMSVRHQGKAASNEANLLFRGNTLLTKSLDFHMSRLGREYLEEVLGPKIRNIIDSGIECELDPLRIGGSGSEAEALLKSNLRRLLEITEDIWQGIQGSTDKCPVELREIFRRISSFAEERYDRFHPSVKYISVSSFLFLRFFVPALLNPRLFGLVKEDPSIPSRRTLTLIAKTLQGLANMTPFGAKEAWMEPMNEFVNKNSENFKHMMERICSIPHDNHSLQQIEPRYQTPLTIMNRLPPALAEGFPSLPYLIDITKSYVMLASLWLENADSVRGKLDDEQVALRKFDTICQSLAAATQTCIDHAERAERPGHVQAFECQDLLRQLEKVGAEISSGKGGEYGRAGSVDLEPHSPSQFRSQKQSFKLSTSAPNLPSPDNGTHPPIPSVNLPARGMAASSPPVGSLPSSHRAAGFEGAHTRSDDLPPSISTPPDEVARRQAHRRTVFHEYPMGAATSNVAQSGQSPYQNRDGSDVPYMQAGSSDSEGTTALPQIDSVATDYGLSKRKKDKKELKKGKKGQDDERDHEQERDLEKEFLHQPQGRSYSLRPDGTAGRWWSNEESGSSLHSPPGTTDINTGTGAGDVPSSTSPMGPTTTTTGGTADPVGDRSRFSASVGPGSSVGYFGGLVPGLGKKRWR